MHPQARRRFQRAVTATALAGCLLAACADGSTTSSDEAPEPTGDGELSGTLEIATTSERGLDLFIGPFEEEAGVSIDGTYAEAGALNEQLRIQITSGTAPDLFRAAPGTASPSAVLTLADEGAVMDLSDQDWAQHVPESFAPLQERDGATYAFPTYGQAMLVFYNRTVFEDAGVEPPTTWSEFIEVCDALAATGTVPLALGLADNYVLQFLPFALAATLVDGAEGDFYERLAAGETSFAESAGWRETFEKFFGLIEDGYTTPDPLGMPSDPAMQAVGSGEAAMVVMPSAASPVLAGFMAGGEEEMGIFALPATDRPDDTHIPFTPDYLVVNADASNADAALAFLDYIAEPERTSAWAEETGAIPALTNAEPVDNELNNTVRPYLEGERTAPFANHVWPSGEVANALMTTGQQVVEGSKTIDDLLAAMDQAYQESTS
ncbi:ABC transporter substrate-binding protein [Phytoactinopolyspora halotolerans]|uniref:Extracellular solute-binding protein n=1 Tax=Phytoactinopolyspora halotolerans TaxID=1981512 RepID=A0A6L9SK52_9ACTN|nr:extracellular solute-binding protein [Phytoactinopolyspora halotolerans]NEE04711.1 extracellular solute-binding protein [Phytoactinopolyspora halotolerans]